MKQKLILRRRGRLNDNIVAIAYTKSSYLDEDFYKEKMGEKVADGSYELKKHRNYPVNVVALPIEWLMKDKRNVSLRFL